MENNQIDKDILDVLNTDLDSVSLSKPVLPAGTYVVKCQDMKIEPSKNGNSLLRITLALAELAYDVNGNAVRAGFPIYDIVSLTPTENYTDADIKRRLKSIRLAFTGKYDGPFMPLDQYIGLQAKVVLKVQPATDMYSERNAVVRYA